MMRIEGESFSAPNDPELRKIIETLAQYVAKNGTNFEEMVKNRELNNPQFFFLRGGDYHQHYQHCLSTERQKLVFQSAPVQGFGPLQAPQLPTPSLQTAVQRAAAIAASLVQQQQQHAPSMSGAYSQHQSYGHGGDAPEHQSYARQPFSYGAPPVHQPMPNRFAPPNWQQPVPLNQGDYSQIPPSQHGFQQGFAPPPLRSRFSQTVPPPQQFAVNNNQRFGPPPSYQVGSITSIPPPQTMGFRPNFVPPGMSMPPQFQPPPLYSDSPTNNEPMQPDARPWYELPAGIMLSLIRTEDADYKSLDPNALVIPPPQPITEKIMRAMDEFYSHPNNAQPRNAEGWEKLGLYDFYKAKDAAKKSVQRGEPVKQYKPGHSRSPSPESRYSSRSRSRSRSRSPRSDSRSRSTSKRRSPALPTFKSRRRSRSRS